MTEPAEDMLSRLSKALAARAAAAGPLVASVAVRGRERLSGTLWRQGLVVVSEQALPRRFDEAEVRLADGRRLDARLAGRDPATNVALLRVGEAAAPAWSPAADPQPGALAMTLGVDGAGASSVRVGAIRHVGPEWHSRAGGRIDRRIMLDLRIEPSEEGGPVIDMTGGLLGISTLGPRRRLLVIPTATVERVLEPLAHNGRIARGWLGVAVQRVTVPEELRAAAGQTEGLMALAVAENGPAAAAGVLMGDILVALDGTGLTGMTRLAGLLGAEAVGKRFALRLIRAGAVHSVEVTIAERPSQ